MLTDSMKASIDAMERRFPNQYTNANQVQSYFDQEEYNLFNLSAAIQKYEEQSLKVKEVHAEKARELALVNEYMPLIQASVDNAKNNELVEKLQNDLKENQFQQVKLEEWMRKNHPNMLIGEEIKYEGHKVMHEYRTAVCKRMAEWFAAGNAGAGKVTFMNKEYVAS